MTELVEDKEDRTPSGFEPDTMLASQFFDRLRGRERRGEWHLMVAILEDAVNVYMKQAAAEDPHQARLFTEAEEWIEAHDRQYVFSFESICDMLGIDPEYLRGGLRRWKTAVRGRAGAEPARREPAGVPETVEGETGGLRRASGGN
ncbi:MAG TPA: hypothetical protein VFD84_01945 [Candidatus Binatia bacterium]|jgi:hypothetical protein|nr:hypothetical protein [Candidatus Binatia bacterium]